MSSVSSSKSSVEDSPTESSEEEYSEVEPMEDESVSFENVTKSKQPRKNVKSELPKKFKEIDDKGLFIGFEYFAV